MSTTTMPAFTIARTDRPTLHFDGVELCRLSEATLPGYKPRPRWWEMSAYSLAPGSIPGMKYVVEVRSRVADRVKREQPYTWAVVAESVEDACRDLRRFDPSSVTLRYAATDPERQEALSLRRAESFKALATAFCESLGDPWEYVPRPARQAGGRPSSPPVAGEAASDEALRAIWAERLREARTQAGWATSAQAAAACGMARTQYHSLEKGLRMPNWRTLCRLINSLGLDKEILFAPLEEEGTE